MANVRRHKGRRPGEGWEQVAVVQNSPRWLVFVRRNPDTVWWSVKVVAEDRAASKANYWLGWNGSRFSRTGDVLALLSRPELLASVQRVLVEQTAAELDAADLM